jgi:hypothetical protein
LPPEWTKANEKVQIEMKLHFSLPFYWVPGDNLELMGTSYSPNRYSFALKSQILVWQIEFKEAVHKNFRSLLPRSDHFPNLEGLTAAKIQPRQSQTLTIVFPAEAYHPSPDRDSA